MSERSSENSPKARPFLKWVGGKGQMLEQFQPHFPKRFGRYVEPFVGGGAVLFHLQPKRALLMDNNRDLIDCYLAVRDHVEEVIASLQSNPSFRYDKELYYQVRAMDPQTLTLPQRAARIIYLNRTGFNGLYRVNSKGLFNVPFGRYVNPKICDEANLRAVSKVLQGVRIEVADFRTLADHVRPQDFIYLDPPYAPVSDTASFTSYVPGGFSQKDQRDLADLFRELSQERDVTLMLSNSDIPFIRELYEDFPIVTVSAKRNVNCLGDRRGKVSEIVVLSH